MHSRLIEWSRYVFLAAVVCALVLVVPVASLPLQIEKLAVFAGLAFIAVLLYALGGGRRDMMRAHGLKLALAVGVLPLAYVLSAYASATAGLAWLGSGIEADTVLFTIIGFVAFIAAFLLFRTLRTVRALLAVVFATLVVAAVFQWVLIFFGASIVPFQIFADRSTNLIGKWNDLGLLAALALSFVLVRLELAPPQAWLRRAGVGICVVALVALLAVINFVPVWGFLLGVCTVLALTAFLMNKGEGSAGAARRQGVAGRMPWVALAGVVVSIVFLFAGPAVNAGLTRTFPVSSLEVRPSYSSTMQIVDAARGGSLGRLIVGTGPGTFTQSWVRNKPAEVNQSTFWALDFNSGFSTLTTALSTVGFVGFFAWLIPLFLVLAGLVRAARLKALSRDEKITTVALGIGVLFFFAMLVFYTPSQNSIVLGLVLSGAAFGFLWRQGRVRTEDADDAPSRIRGIGMLLALPLFLVLSLFASIVSARHFVAEAAVGKGTQLLQAGDQDGALRQAAFAAKIEKSNPDPLRLSVGAGTAKLQLLASTDASATDAAAIQTTFTTLAQQVVSDSQTLIAKNPADYRSYMLAGQLYELFASLKVQGAYEQAQQSYTDAASRNPTNPQIPLLMARLEAGQNNIQAVQKYLTQSLTLKPNYTDAILFLVQLNVAQNDLPSAIQAAQAAAQSAPGVPSIWFELGLLYYSAGNTAQAIAPLEQAVALVPEYANAKYFLGLSYYAQKRPSDAVKEFEDLSRSNPDSAEVQLILSNLRAGKPPFEAAVPPVTTPPQDRTTAPIAE